MPDLMYPLAINKDIARTLTGGEADLARSIFGAALNTRRVRIHNFPYLPWQGRSIAMTPNGKIYFRKNDYKPDFSLTKSDAAWLVHELTHAWQHQTGRSTRLRGLRFALQKGGRRLEKEQETPICLRGLRRGSEAEPVGVGERTAGARRGLPRRPIRPNLHAGATNGARPWQTFRAS